MIPDEYDYLIVCVAHEAEARAACADKETGYVVVSTEPARCEWNTYQRESIRALDGPALTKVAWKLGLAPEGVFWPADSADAWDEEWQPWNPWLRLSQADAVFRSLRAREWRTTVTATWRSGQCAAAWPYAPYHEVRCTWDGAEHTEARALLLCAVLAVVARRGKQHE